MLFAEGIVKIRGKRSHANLQTHLESLRQALDSNELRMSRKRTVYIWPSRGVAIQAKWVEGFKYLRSSPFLHLAGGL